MTQAQTNANELDLDLDALGEQIAETGTDFSNPSAGLDFEAPAEGATRLRLYSYIETGIHSTVYKGQTKSKKRVELGFELSGPKHEPRASDNGPIPHRINLNETIGFTEKNGIIKLFKRMTAEFPGVKNFVQLIGAKGGWRAKVVHNVVEKEGKKTTYANLRDADGAYTIQGMTFEDEETGDLKRVTPAPMILKPRVFLWDNPSLAQWNTIFIDGTYDNGDSKNRYQDKIRQAENFPGSPIQLLLAELGREDAEPLTKKARAPKEGEAKPTPAKVNKPAPQKSALDTVDDDADPLAGV